MRCIIYARCSTAEQTASGLGIEAQLERCRGHATAHGYTVAAELLDNGCSGSLPPAKRPGLSRALAMLRQRGDAAGGVLIAARVDRLGRNLGDLDALGKRARREGWHLAALDVGMDTATSTGTMLYQILGVFSEFERNRIAERTSAALQALKARGVRMGRPVELSPEARQRVRELRASGLSMNATAARLNAEAVARPRGGQWNATAVSRAERADRLDAEAEAARKAAEAV